MVLIFNFFLFSIIFFFIIYFLLIQYLFLFFLIICFILFLFLKTALWFYSVFFWKSPDVFLYIYFYFTSLSTSKLIDCWILNKFLYEIHITLMTLMLLLLPMMIIMMMSNTKVFFIIFALIFLLEEPFFFKNVANISLNSLTLKRSSFSTYSCHSISLNIF